MPRFEASTHAAEEAAAEAVLASWEGNIPDYILNGTEPPPSLEQELEFTLSYIPYYDDELQKREWLLNPSQWVTERLGENLWSKQVEIMESVRDNRRTAVPSCFDAGKSYTAARIAAWWIDSHPPGKAGVVSTASRFAQVRAILWRELRRAHAKGNLRGRVNQTEWHIPVPLENGGMSEELVAYGRKPDDEDETGFHGFHGRWMLGLIDEASGVSTTLCNSIENLIANEESRLCAIGNPEDPTSEFKSMCDPGSGWNVIQIKAWETPNFTGERISPDDKDDEAIKAELISKVWVKEREKKWGKKSWLVFCFRKASGAHSLLNLLAISLIGRLPNSS